MKSIKLYLIIISILFFSCIGNSSEFDPKRYTASEISLSLNHRFLIIIDYNLCEGGRYPARAILYNLPLNTEKSRKIYPAHKYSWSGDSKYIATQKWTEDLNNFLPVIKTEIILYDNLGNELLSPGYGTSPVFLLDSSNEIIYYNEFSDEGKIDSPKLVSYNLKTKNKKIIYTFENKYTFWSEQIDMYYPPTFPDYHWGGIRGVIYFKNKLDEKYTFVVSKGKLIMWFKGDVTYLTYPPQDDEIKK